MLLNTATVASMLATAARAGLIDALDVGSRGMENRMEHLAENLLMARQAASSGTTSSISVNSTLSSMNMTAWNTDTTAACTQALSQLSVSSNPSGTAVCYNLASFDTTGGTFIGDLRLFQISAPSGDFATIAPQDIQVGLSYHGSSVSPLNTSTIQARSLDEISKRSTPTQIQAYMFVGQVDKSQLSQTMSMSAVEAFTLPVVTLTGKALNGGIARTNVSSNEAAFVNGVFANSSVLSATAVAQLAVNNVTAQLDAGQIAFVVPGVNILIFPVGLVITSVWLVIGVAFYGLGTYERIQYRDSFRRRRAVVGKPVGARI